MSVSPEVLKRIKKVAFYKYEPNVQDVLWAKPVGDGIYEFYVYFNGTWNSIAGGENGITINISDVTGDLSTFNNDAGFVTSEDIGSAVEGLYEKPSDGIPKSDLSSSVQSSLDKADSALSNTTTIADLEDATHKTVTPTEKATWNAKLSSETDPTVPAWAKEATKPTYTADEVGALPSNTNVNNAYNIAIYYSYKLKTACGRYMILVTYDEEYILPVTAENNNTGTDKVMTDLSFDPFGQVYYYHATSNKSADSTFPNGGNPVLFTQYNLTSHLMYSFNMSSNPVARKAFYLVMSPQSDGRCKLHSTPFTQTLPTTEDGLVYKYLGMVSSSDNLLLAQDKPCYYYKDGKLRLWTGG